MRSRHRSQADREHHKRLADLDPNKVDPKNYDARKEYEYLFESEKEWYEREKAKQDRMIVQMSWNSFIVPCWATYEIYFERLGEYARKKKNIKLRSNKIKGDKSSRLKDYFSEVLSGSEVSFQSGRCIAAGTAISRQHNMIVEILTNEEAQSNPEGVKGRMPVVT